MLARFAERACAKWPCAVSCLSCALLGKYGADCQTDWDGTHCCSVTCVYAQSESQESVIAFHLAVFSVR